MILSYPFSLVAIMKPLTCLMSSVDTKMNENEKWILSCKTKTIYSYVIIRSFLGKCSFKQLSTWQNELNWKVNVLLYLTLFLFFFRRSTINGSVGRKRSSIPRNDSILSKLQSAFSGSKSGLGSTFSIFGGGKPSAKGQRPNPQRRPSRMSHMRMSQSEDQVGRFTWKD